MERGARCLIPIENTDAAERTRYRTSPEFAPEPSGLPSPGYIRQFGGSETPVRVSPGAV